MEHITNIELTREKNPACLTVVGLCTVQPPSRISHVVVTNVEQEGPPVEAGTVLLDLKWTAPGKDLTSGTGEWIEGGWWAGGLGRWEGGGQVAVRR